MHFRCSLISRLFLNNFGNSFFNYFLQLSKIFFSGKNHYQRTYAAKSRLKSSKSRLKRARRKKRQQLAGNGKMRLTRYFPEIYEFIRKISRQITMCPCHFILISGQNQDKMIFQKIWIKWIKCFFQILSRFFSKIRIESR